MNEEITFTDILWIVTTLIAGIVYILITVTIFDKINSIIKYILNLSNKIKTLEQKVEQLKKCLNERKDL